MQIDQMLATGRHDIAVPDPVATICAAVPMDRPLAVHGRWERDGRRIAATDPERRDAPGFGECLTNDGDRLDDGSYQYIATDSEGHESAAGGIVVGADRIEQRFRNDGTRPCARCASHPTSAGTSRSTCSRPSRSRPGAEVTLAVADVEQDVETMRCDDTLLASFSFRPSAKDVQSLAP